MVWYRMYLTLNIDLFPSQSPCNDNFLSSSTSSYCHHNYLSGKTKIITVTTLKSLKKVEPGPPYLLELTETAKISKR